MVLRVLEVENQKEWKWSSSGVFSKRFINESVALKPQRPA